jgi:hypothetical protein
MNLQNVWCILHIVYANLDIIVHTHILNVFRHGAAYVLCIISITYCVNGFSFGQISMIFSKGQLLMLSHPFEQIVAPYLWIEFLILLATQLNKSYLELFKKSIRIEWYGDNL